MEITIKPYSAEYAGQCAELERFLWKEDKHSREERFKWEYTDCPNYDHPLCVIAVNEENEVLGFRGYFINKFKIGKSVVRIALLADTVVSDKARRMGIFQKMTEFSLKYLSDNKISFILNLSPSWPPYHGYKKLGFEDLAPFHSKYRFSLINLFVQKVCRNDRTDWINKQEFTRPDVGLEFHLCQNITDDALKNVEALRHTDKINSYLDFSNLKWRTKHPNGKYVYAYAKNSDGRLLSFMMLSTSDYYTYHLGLLLYDDLKTSKKLFKAFVREYKPAILAAWDFAVEDRERKFFSKSDFHSIPFINKVRKNPPALVRTLLKNEDGSLNWCVNGLDIRKVENWNLSKLDLDSF